jgi:hypothetical protein
MPSGRPSRRWNGGAAEEGDCVGIGMVATCLAKGKGLAIE